MVELQSLARPNCGLIRGFGV